MKWIVHFCNYEWAGPQQPQPPDPLWAIPPWRQICHCSTGCLGETKSSAFMDIMAWNAIRIRYARRQQRDWDVKCMRTDNYSGTDFFPQYGRQAQVKQLQILDIVCLLVCFDAFGGTAAGDFQGWEHFMGTMQTIRHNEITPANVFTSGLIAIR